jgi:hypothetical protein
MEEQRLIQRVARNETEALGEAYDLHHAPVRAFARRLLGSEAAAEDLVHDVFLQLPKVIGRFEGRSTLRTFLLSIAVKLSRNVRRARFRRDDALERLHLEPRSANESPEELEDRRRLAMILARLVPQIYEGKTTEAKVLNILGATMAADITKRIADGKITPPNAPATLERVLDDSSGALPVGASNAMRAWNGLLTTSDATPTAAAAWAILNDRIGMEAWRARCSEVADRLSETDDLGTQLIAFARTRRAKLGG